MGVRFLSLNIAKRKSKLPDLQVTPLEQGLDQAIVWFWRERVRLLPV